MNHKFATPSITLLRTLIATSAALLSTLQLVACSGGAQAALPLAPSALPFSMPALEAADGSADGSDTWDTLGNKGKDGQRDAGKDKDKGKDADDDASVAPTTVKIEGVVSTVTGACPTVTFVVGQHSMVTDAATKFDDGLCAQLVPQASVEVRAVRRADGTLLAKDVEFEDAGVDDDEDTENEDGEGNPHHGAGPFDGTVSSFRGVCPAVTFNLRGLTIVADAATTYVGGTCATLRPNVQVVVTGAVAPGRRMFKAATITITRTH